MDGIKSKPFIKIEEYEEQLKGSILRLFGKLYNQEQLYNVDLLTTNEKPYPRNEDIERFMIDVAKDVYKRAYSNGHSNALSVITKLNKK